MTPPRLTPLAAAALLACFFAASVAGMLDNSHHPDESCRIASGYTYLRYGNMRLNPEDPPLGKELAAFPLLFLHLRLPVDLAALRPGNIGRGDSFTFAARLLYEQDIPPETILFFPRLIAVLSATALGALLFAVTRNRWGDAAALIALCFYCLSPTVLANTPIVGLDVLGALGAFGAFWVFLRFLTEPTRTNAIRTGLVVGSVELLKFSLLPLIPYFVLLVVAWCWANSDRVPLQNGIASMLKKTLGALIIAFGLVFLCYQLHFWTYPTEQNAAEVATLVRETSYAGWAPVFATLSVIPGVRVLVQIFIGIAWRAYYSAPFTYLLGEGYYGSRPLFYPVALWVKEPIALHIALLLALWKAVGALRRLVWTKELVSTHFALFAAGGWVLFFVTITLFSGINDGLRHLLPIYPFAFMLLGVALASWCTMSSVDIRRELVFLLILWNAWSVGRAHPHYLAYFNEWVAPGKGYQYLTLSNLDLHLEAKRLGRWAREHDIDKLKVPTRITIFADGDRNHPGTNFWYSRAYEYYLGSRYEAMDGDVPTTGWIAIPGSQLAWGRARPADRSGWGSDSLRWLDGLEPVAIIGNSVYVFYVSALPVRAGPIP